MINHHFMIDGWNNNGYEKDDNEIIIGYWWDNHGYQCG